MGKSIKEDQLLAAFRTQLEILEVTDEQSITMENAKICLEEMRIDERIRTSIPLDEGWEEYQAWQTETGHGLQFQAGNEEWLRFHKYAEANLVSSKDILAFSEKRGARVEVVNSAAKIRGHNGVQVRGSHK